MAELPVGTVTLLFSDVEGSTLLLSRLGPEYAAALDGLRQVQRAAWAAHGGTELGTEGDSFYVVFSTAEGAVSAAVQAQRALVEFAWPGGESVRVRMGIHMGHRRRMKVRMLGWMCTGRLELLVLRMAGRSWCLGRPRTW